MPIIETIKRPATSPCNPISMVREGPTSSTTACDLAAVLAEVFSGVDVGARVRAEVLIEKLATETHPLQGKGRKSPLLSRNYSHPVGEWPDNSGHEYPGWFWHSW